jgi:hypothetical protein
LAATTGQRDEVDNSRRGFLKQAVASAAALTGVAGTQQALALTPAGEGVSAANQKKICGAMPTAKICTRTDVAMFATTSERKEAADASRRGFMTKAVVSAAAAAAGTQEALAYTPAGEGVSAANQKKICGAMPTAKICTRKDVAMFATTSERVEGGDKTMNASRRGFMTQAVTSAAAVAAGVAGTQEALAYTPAGEGVSAANQKKICGAMPTAKICTRKDVAMFATTGERVEGDDATMDASRRGFLTQTVASAAAVAAGVVGTQEALAYTPAGEGVSAANQKKICGAMPTAKICTRKDVAMFATTGERVEETMDDSRRSFMTQAIASAATVAAGVAGTQEALAYTPAGEGVSAANQKKICGAMPTAKICTRKDVAMFATTGERVEGGDEAMDASRRGFMTQAVSAAAVAAGAAGTQEALAYTPAGEGVSAANQKKICGAMPTAKICTRNDVAMFATTGERVEGGDETMDASRRGFMTQAVASAAAVAAGVAGTQEALAYTPAGEGVSAANQKKICGAMPTAKICTRKDVAMFATTGERVEGGDGAVDSSRRGFMTQAVASAAAVAAGAAGTQQAMAYTPAGEGVSTENQKKICGAMPTAKICTRK